MKPADEPCLTHSPKGTFVLLASVVPNKAKDTDLINVDFPEPLSPRITCQPTGFSSSSRCQVKFLNYLMFSN